MLGMLVILGLTLVAYCSAPPAASAATASNSFAIGPVFGHSGASTDFFPTVSGVSVGPPGSSIFVAQSQTSAAAVFSPDPANGGVDLTTAGFGASGLAAVQNVAVDPTNGTVYADDNFFTGTIGKLVSDGASTPTYATDIGFAPSGAVVSPGGMAVDPSSHDLLVVDVSSRRVVRVSSTNGSAISSFDGADTTVGAFQAPASIAVNTPGTTIYVVDAGQRVERFTAAGTALGALPLPSGSVPSSVAVNPSTGEAAVLLSRQGQTYLQGFTSGGTPTFSARITPVFSGAASGLAWDGLTNRIYAAYSDATVRTFVAATQPGVDAPIATPGRNTVHLTGEVAPGGQSTTAHFEYCPASEACDSYAVSDSNPANPWQRGPEHSGLTTTTTIQDDLPLSSNASWKVRLSAVNDDATNAGYPGTDNTSATTSFNSPLLSPGVTTQVASAVTASQAELNGTIDTLGDQTSYHFEYGLTSSYGKRVPASSDAPAGNHRTPRAVSQFLGGLQPGTVYHYRLVARNSAGQNAGADRTFTTEGRDQVAPMRGYEQVTPVDKDGAQVSSDAHVQAAVDGSWFAVATTSSTSDGQGTKIRQNYLSRRGLGDWNDWLGVEAPQDAAPGLFMSSTNAVSADGDHALVGSNRVLAPGGIAGGGNLYIKDLRTGSYTFVAGGPGNAVYMSLENIQMNESLFVAGSSDFSWVMFFGTLPLTSDPAVTGPALYRWSRADGLSVVSRIPDPSNPSSEVIAPFVQTNSVYRLTMRSASSDGNVVAFSAGAVYRRANGQTQAISVSHRTGDPPDPQPANYDEMSIDGRYVFFHTPVPLTDDTPGGVGSSNEGAYRYDAVTGDLEFIGLTALNNGELFYGASDDGSTAYYDDGSGVAVWRNGVVRVVTSSPLVAPRTYITQNGRYFGWSDSDDQAHVYDAEADRDVCASCRADGGPNKPSRFLQNARYMGNEIPRTVTEDGAMFFDTATPLVSADHNGKRDVYAYHNGRQTLISPGDDNFDAMFVGASADGSDIFFQTDEPLVSRDVDKSADIYDARVGGGFPKQSPPPPAANCLRSDCGELQSGPTTSSSVSSSSTGDGPVAKRTNQEKVRIAFRRLNFGAKTANITVVASERGRLRVSGSRVVTTIRNISKEGTYSISVRLSKKAIALHRAHRRFKVSMSVSLAGGWGSALVKVSRTLGK